ncbi:MAG: DUF5060 domain-containing protein [Pseudomonadota bacterium]
MPAVSGELKQWHKVTLDFESNTVFTEEPETFRDHRLDVTFTNQDTGEVLVIPGFFAADGDAAESGATSGNVWRVHFNPPSEGNWTYQASFRTGDDIAISLNPNEGTELDLVGPETGSLSIEATDKTGEDFRAKGMILQDEGTHYLQHQGDGDYFIRGGPGVPENFLATDSFDNTGDGRHEFDAHADDFNPGDPTWSNGDGKNIVGAVNYIAEQGLNTIYFLTNTIGGDGQDVGPWVDPDIYDVGKNKSSIENAANTTNGLSADAFSVYDISKLSQWDILFDHMDAKGIYKNVLFQETENDQLLNGGTDVDGSSLSVERLVYMREMIARFGHNNGIQWNLGEENTNSLQEREDMADYVKAIDPYDHLVVLHTFPNQINSYNDLLGHESFDGPSFQTSPNSIRDQTIEFRDKSADAGDPWVLSWDEHAGTFAEIDVGENNPDSTNERTLRQELWGHLTANGTGVNWYLRGNGFGGHSFDQNIDDFTGFTSIWDWTAAANEFFNTFIPFWEMTNDDSVTTNSGDYVMSKRGEYYVVYLDYGQADDVRLNLSDASGETFDVFWYDPRNGGDLIDAGQVDGGGVVDFANPPNSVGKDWVLFVRNSDLPDKPPSVDPGAVPTPPDPAPAPEPGDQEASFNLINAANDQVVSALQDGDVIDLGVNGLSEISIQALPDDNVGSVVFTLDGQVQQTENVAPYALFGDSSGDYDAGDLAEGDHTLSVALYSGSNGSGTLLGTSEISFEVAASAPADPQPDPGPGQDPEPTPPADPNDDPIFLMDDGLVVMQAEDGVFVIPDAPGNDTWALTTEFDGFKGDGVLLFDTNKDFFNDSNGGQPQTGPLKYTFRVPDDGDAEGTYYISLRSVRPVTGEPGDRNNDFFVATSKAGEDPGEYTKVFFSGAREQFQFGSTYDKNHQKSPATFEVDGPGDYTIYISGRSRQAGLDEIHIQKGSVSRNHDAPTSETFTVDTAPPADPPPPPPPVDTTPPADDPTPPADDPTPPADPSPPAEPELQEASFNLIDAESDTVVSDLEDGDVIIVGSGGLSELSIQAVPSGNVGSIVFSLNGEPVQTENIQPYALFGDNSGDYTGDTLPAGSHILSATLFSGKNGTGDNLGTSEISFDVADSTPADPDPAPPADPEPDPTPEPESEVTFTLVNSKTDQVLFSFSEGEQIDVSGINLNHLSMKVEHERGDEVESVSYELDGNFVRTENYEPYALFGDDVKGNYFRGNIGLGEHTVVTTFHSEDRGKGDIVDTAQITFEFVNEEQALLV